MLIPTSASKGTLHVLVSDGDMLDRLRRNGTSGGQKLDLASTIGVLNKQHVNFENVAYTLQIGRVEMPCRLAIVAHHQEELIQQLEQWKGNPETPHNRYFSERKTTLDESNGQVIDSSDLGRLARTWVAGNAVPWSDLHQGKQRVRITGLPTYPFKRRTCWIERKQDIGKVGDTSEASSYNKAVEFYTLMAEKSNVASVQPPAEAALPTVQTEYLTFCPFEEKVPGFSMSKVFLHAEKYPDEIRRIQVKQTEMRQVLFCQEDFQQVHTLFDIGCGHGTDVIQIAALYPHITTHGFTITQAQAELGQRRITELNLSPQA